MGIGSVNMGTECYGTVQDSLKTYFLYFTLLPFSPFHIAFIPINSTRTTTIFGLRGI